MPVYQVGGVEMARAEGCGSFCPGPWIATVPLLFLVGCGDRTEDAPVSVYVQRDSAGVTIVENAVPADGSVPRWEVSELPDLSIGGAEADPSTQLFQVQSVAQLENGRIVVANGGTDEILYFDRTGTLLVRAGGTGEGPGEFSSVSRLWVLSGDSAAVSDPVDRSLTVLDPDGAMVREVVYGSESRELADGVISWPIPAGVFEDGSYFMSSRLGVLAYDADSGPIEVSSPHYRWIPETNELQQIGSLPAPGMFLHPTYGMLLATPFDPRPVSIAHGSSLFRGSGGQFEISEHTLDGELRRLIRLDHADRPVTSADIDRHSEAYVSGGSDDENRRRRRRLLEAVGFPEVMPAIDQLRIDSDENLWVREYIAFDDELPIWWIFDPDGRLLATAETPVGLDVQDIGRDVLLGIEEDALEIESLVRYALDRGEGL